MGGDFAVDSREGEGSEFRFHVLMRPAGEPAPAAQTPAATGPLRVLLAEDNEVNRVVAIGMVTKLGHRIEAVENGAEAVAAVPTRRIRRRADGRDDAGNGRIDCNPEDPRTAWRPGQHSDHRGLRRAPFRDDEGGMPAGRDERLRAQGPFPRSGSHASFA